MNATDRITAYFDRWNARDGARVAALFAPDGSYTDPVAGGEATPDRLSGAVAEFAVGLADWRLEPEPPLIAGDRGAVEWTLIGTPVAGSTVAAIRVPGVDVFTLSDAGFVRVSRHFDRRQLAVQLGQQVLVQPWRQGPAVFGYSMRASSGSPHPPAVIALTWILARDAAEQDRIRGHSRQIVQDFLAEPGFLGIVTGFAGDRGFTVTAWESEAALHAALGKRHAVAMREFHTADLSPGVWTSVWKPDRMNRVWTRCPACGSPNNVNDDHRPCAKCGAALPPRPSFW